MSVSTSISSTGGLVGNSSTAQAYVVPFAFELPTDLTVLRADSAGNLSTLALGSDYTVTQNTDGTGYIFTTAAWDSSNTLTISRNVPLTQPLTLLPGAKEPASALNGAFDRLTYICQQLSRTVQRCIRVSDASPAISALNNSVLTSNSVIVAGEDSALHFWTFEKLAQELSARASIPSAQNWLQVLYPVGALYFTLRTENPRDILGFGTWIRHGSGKMIVSLDPTNPAFSTVGQTGGEATHALTAEENGAHVHSVSPQNITTATGDGSHVHSITPPTVNTGENAAVQISYPMGKGYGSNPYQVAPGDTIVNSNIWMGIPVHTHPVVIPPFDSGVAGAHTHSVTIPQQNTQAAGSGTAHNNMPPYIVVNVWVRVGTDATEFVDGTLPFPDDLTRFTDGVTGTRYKIVINDGIIGIEPTA